jgi:hypothetical protein
MWMAGVFATILLLGLILGDWMRFTRLTPAAARYGCAVARLEDVWRQTGWDALVERFGRHGVLNLPHGIARLFGEERRILLRPQYRLFSLRFRTAWPLKACIEVEPEGGGTRLTCVKRLPWSSALITGAWFTLVLAGTLGFLVAYGLNGGLGSMGGVLMALGIVALGLLVLAFGVVTVSLGYSLENERLTKVYEELRAALSPT